MQFLNPYGAWALTSLAVIAALYLLKRRYVDQVVPSALLWQRALNDLSADRPFQKLRKSLLLLAQLLMALLIALSLMRPALPGGGGSEAAFVFDVSASMGAADTNRTRLEKSASDAWDIVQRMGAGARVTVITAGREVREVLARSADPAEVKRALDALTPEDGGAKAAGALSVARALSREAEGLVTYFYSDSPPPDGTDAVARAPFSGADNRAVRSLAASGAKALARLVNYGAACRLTVECYADGALCDVRKVDLPEGGDEAVQFQVPEEAKRLTARIVEDDALTADNSFEAATPHEAQKTIALAGADDVFLEKALSLRDDVTLVRSSALEAVAAGGFSLYAFEGDIPEALPEGAPLMLIDFRGAKEHPSGIKAADNALARLLTENMPMDDLAVRAYRALDAGTPILTAGGDAVLTVYEEGGRRVALMGFDPHESNLPAKMDFPVLIGNLLNWLLPEESPAGEAVQNIPPSESDIRAVPASGSAPAAEAAPGAGRELTDILLLLFFGMLFVEWEVRARGR
jgi:hypothetical protein